MQFTDILHLALIALATVSALPNATPEEILLDNGSEIITATIAARSDNPAALFKRDSFSCSGSSQCGSMAASDCDGARDRIVGGNIYHTRGTAGATGVCYKRCGLFVSGINCDLSGNEMFTAFNELRARNCKICGKKTYGDGCQFKMDVVTGC